MSVDTTELRKLAEAQTEAYRVMVMIGEGVGGLGLRHPERFASMLSWQNRTENDHADTVIALLDELAEARAWNSKYEERSHDFEDRLEVAEGKITRALEALNKADEDFDNGAPWDSAVLDAHALVVAILTEGTPQ